MIKYAVALAALLTSSALAHADVILTFGQTGGTPIVATANAAGTQTTIRAINAGIDVTEILAGVSTPAPAFFDLNIASIDFAQPLGAGASQHYSGSFSITSGSGDTGTNYLSGSFTDILVGVGPSGDIAVGAPPDTINFTSDVISVLSLPSAIALSFAGVKPAIHIDNETIASFTSSVSGTFSASPVPEPASLAILGMGVLGIAAFARRRA